MSRDHSSPITIVTNSLLANQRDPCRERCGFFLCWYLPQRNHKDTGLHDCVLSVLRDFVVNGGAEGELGIGNLSPALVEQIAQLGGLVLGKFDVIFLRFVDSRINLLQYVKA